MPLSPIADPILPVGEKTPFRSMTLWVKLVIGFFISCSSIAMYSQEPILEITGKVFSEEGPIEDVHILNLRSRLGTITDSDGTFTIPAKQNDTLIFSNIQYHPLGLVVNNQVINRKILEIEMIPKIEELREIQLKGHDLKGLFLLDSNNSPDSLAYFSSETLDFDRESFNDPTSSNYIVPKASLLNLVDMVGKKKRRDNQQQLKYQKALEKAAEDIREQLGDDLFVNRLNIPKHHIIPFIEYCEKEEILELHVKKRTIEVIDVLVKNSEPYRDLYVLSN